MNKALGAALFLLAIVLLVAHLEHRWTPGEEEMRSAYLRPCDATISDRLHYVDAASERCYFFKSVK